MNWAVPFADAVKHCADKYAEVEIYSNTVLGGVLLAVFVGVPVIVLSAMGIEKIGSKRGWWS